MRLFSDNIPFSNSLPLSIVYICPIHRGLPIFTRVNDEQKLEARYVLAAYYVHFLNFIFVKKALSNYTFFSAEFSAKVSAI